MALTTRQALDRFHSTDLIGIGMEADAIRRRLHPENVVTYANHLPAPSPIPAAQSPIQIVAHAAASNRSIRDTLAELHAADLALVADHDDQAVVPIGPDSLPFDLYLEIHRTAHQLGIPSTAAMVFGCGETLDQRAAHLEAIANLQQETGGLLSFAPIAHQPTARGHLPADWEEATAVEFLKTLAVARIMLESVPSLVAESNHQPLKVLQMALRFGADDAGDLTRNPAPNPAPNQPSALHRTATPAEADLRRIIRDAGLRPVQRDPAYRLCYLTD